jgi:hypothetical protein
MEISSAAPAEVIDPMLCEVAAFVVLVAESSTTIAASVVQLEALMPTLPAELCVTVIVSDPAEQLSLYQISATRSGVVTVLTAAVPALAQPVVLTEPATLET